MEFFRGFVIWGIVAVIAGLLCYCLWKYYFCRVRGFENRKHTTLLGCILIFITTMSYLFLPLVLCKATLFTQTKNRFVDGIKNDIVARTRDAFYEDAEDVLTGIVDSVLGENVSVPLEKLLPNATSGDTTLIGDVCIKDIPLDTLSSLSEEEASLLKSLPADTKVSDLSQIFNSELQRRKQNVVQYAIKYSKNRTLKDSLENAFKLLEIGDYNFGGLTEEKTLAVCNQIVDDYSRDIKKSYVQNSLMKPWVTPIVKNVSMESFTGLPANPMAIRAFNKAKDAFDKLFLLIASCLSIVTAVVIFLILYLLREDEEKIEIKSKRNYMFEYNEKSFEEMNAKKI